MYNFLVNYVYGPDYRLYYSISIAERASLNPLFMFANFFGRTISKGLVIDYLVYPTTLLGLPFFLWKSPSFRRNRLVHICCLWILAYMALLSMNTYQPPRYSVPLVPPIMILFSAMMVGLGRAVGETMIVLMAAGNTPILEWNAFSGFRTLSANIATELPEAVRDSTHYRTLFFAGLVLFAMTFVINTLAEGVRRSFRARYTEQL